MNATKEMNRKKHLGRTPNRHLSPQTYVRFTKPVTTAIRTVTDKEKRTHSSLISLAVEAYLRQHYPGVLEELESQRSDLLHANHRAALSTDY